MSERAAWLAEVQRLLDSPQCTRSFAIAIASALVEDAIRVEATSSAKPPLPPRVPWTSEEIRQYGIEGTCPPQTR